MLLEKLTDALDERDVTGPLKREVTGVVSDSRQVREGRVFVAVPGTREDGARYIPDACARGAAAVVTEETATVPKGTARVIVPDARAALSALAAAFNGRPADSLRTIGVTGTNGKTTCAYVLRDILEAAGVPTGCLTTVTYEVGGRSIPASRTTPGAPELHGLLRQMVGAGCRAAVMEVSSHALVQQRVADVGFDVVAFTNLTRDHLDYHGSMAAYFDAKVGLFRHAGTDRKAVGVVNVDDPWGERLALRPDVDITRVTCGTSADALVRAEDVALTANGLAFTLVTPWGKNQRIKSRLLGRFNVSNLLAVAAMAGVLGVPMDTVAEVLRTRGPVRGRLDHVVARRAGDVFVDYAHTDDALTNVLATLREITRGKLIVVFGCGGDRDRTKRPLMGRAVSRGADHAVLTSDNPRSESPDAIIAEVLPGIEDALPCDVIPDRREAIRHALALLSRGDVLLVAGKGHEAFQELANRTVTFDDRRVIAEELEAL